MGYASLHVAKKHVTEVSDINSRSFPSSRQGTSHTSSGHPAFDQHISNNQLPEEYNHQTASVQVHSLDNRDFPATSVAPINEPIGQENSEQDEVKLIKKRMEHERKIRLETARRHKKLLRKKKERQLMEENERRRALQERHVRRRQASEHISLCTQTQSQSQASQSLNDTNSKRSSPPQQAKGRPRGPSSISDRFSHADLRVDETQSHAIARPLPSVSGRTIYSEQAFETMSFADSAAQFREEAMRLRDWYSVLDQKELHEFAMFSPSSRQISNTLHETQGEDDDSIAETFSCLSTQTREMTPSEQYINQGKVHRQTIAPAHRQIDSACSRTSNLMDSCVSSKAAQKIREGAQSLKDPKIQLQTQDPQASAIDGLVAPRPEENTMYYGIQTEPVQGCMSEDWKMQDDPSNLEDSLEFGLDTGSNAQQNKPSTSCSRGSPRSVLSSQTKSSVRNDTIPNEETNNTFGKRESLHENLPPSGRHRQKQHDSKPKKRWGGGRESREDRRRREAYERRMRYAKECIPKVHALPTADEGFGHGEVSNVKARNIDEANCVSTNQSSKRLSSYEPKQPMYVPHHSCAASSENSREQDVQNPENSLGLTMKEEQLKASLQKLDQELHRRRRRWNNPSEDWIRRDRHNQYDEGGVENATSNVNQLSSKIHRDQHHIQKASKETSTKVAQSINTQTIGGIQQNHFQERPQLVSSQQHQHSLEWQLPIKPVIPMRHPRHDEMADPRHATPPQQTPTLDVEKKNSLQGITLHGCGSEAKRPLTPTPSRGTVPGGRYLPGRPRPDGVIKVHNNFSLLDQLRSLLCDSPSGKRNTKTINKFSEAITV